MCKEEIPWLLAQLGGLTALLNSPRLLKPTGPLTGDHYGSLYCSLGPGKGSLHSLPVLEEEYGEPLTSPQLDHSPASIKANIFLSSLSPLCPFPGPRGSECPLPSAMRGPDPHQERSLQTRLLKNPEEVGSEPPRASSRVGAFTNPSACALQTPGADRGRRMGPGTIWAQGAETPPRTAAPRPRLCLHPSHPVNEFQLLSDP